MPTPQPHSIRRLPSTAVSPVKVSTTRPRQRQPGWLQPPTGLGWACIDAIAWVAGAVALRIGVGVSIAIAPASGLWGIPLLCAPAIFFTGIALHRPQLSLLTGYRLLLVALGLWLGGRI